MKYFDDQFGARNVPHAATFVHQVPTSGYQEAVRNPPLDSVDVDRVSTGAFPSMSRPSDGRHHGSVCEP